MGFALDNRSLLLQPMLGRISNIGAGKVCSIDIPPGATYASFTLQLFAAATPLTRANIETMLTQWRLLVSGKEMWTLTGKQMLAIIAFYNANMVDDSGYIEIPFNRLFMEAGDSAFSDILGPNLGTLGETSVTLEITQDATSTLDTLNMWTKIQPIAEPLGAHVEVKRISPALPGSGDFAFAGLAKDPGWVNLALHLELDDVTKLTRIVYECDGIRVIDTTPAVLNREYLCVNPIRTVQTAKKFVHVEFTRRNLSLDAVPMTMNTQNLILTFSSAPTTLNILQEVATRDATPANAAK